MRTEHEVIELILSVARADDRIRAVILSGSRADPGALKDILRDYDITYLVRDIAPFRSNTDWIERCFGKPAIMQMPEGMTLLASDDTGRFAYLMIFDDGIRIDLSVEAILKINDGEPAIALLDKDGTLPDLSARDASLWQVKPPSPELFADCCNEFWWCLNNVGKGIARDEIPYAMKMLNDYVRDMLDLMTGWYIGTGAGFQVSTGKLGKHFKRHLPVNLYEMYLSTYPSPESDELWDSVSTACDLFHILAVHVAGHCGFIYNQPEEDGMRNYLGWVKGKRSILLEDDLRR